MRFILALVAAGIMGCAQSQLSIPSGASVQGGIANVKKYNDVAVVHNANAMTISQRIEAKATVLKKYWGK